MGANRRLGLFRLFDPSDYLRTIGVSNIENAKWHDPTGWRSALIGNGNKYPDAVAMEPMRFVNGQIRAALCKAHFPSNVGRTLGFVRRMFCPMCSPSRKKQSETTYTQPKDASPKSPHSPNCRITSGVCGFPLGAKIALTVIMSLGASSIFSFTMWEFFEGRRNAMQLLLTGLLACGLCVVSYVGFFWGGTY